MPCRRERRQQQLPQEQAALVSREVRASLGAACTLPCPAMPCPAPHPPGHFSHPVGHWRTRCGQSLGGCLCSGACPLACLSSPAEEDAESALVPGGG